MDTEKKPLGYVSLLNNTQRAIYPMDDFFISYVFNKEKNWGHLRDILNIFLDAYTTKYNKHDGSAFVDEPVTVETQYEHYIQKTSKRQAQDIKANAGAENQTYIAFRNKSVSKPPVSIRADNYSGLSVYKTEDGAGVSQIWLLAENDDNVLRGQAISNFRMVEDNTGEYSPREMNIMFVSLPRLAKEMNLCGELSQLLMGICIHEVSDELKPILEMFEREYESFRKDRGVILSMTILEERYAEGMAIGESRSAAEYNARAEKVIVAKIRNRDGLTGVKKLAADLGISAERFKELYTANRSAPAKDSRSER